MTIMSTKSRTPGSGSPKAETYGDQDEAPSVVAGSDTVLQHCSKASRRQPRVLYVAATSPACEKVGQQPTSSSFFALPVVHYTAHIKKQAIYSLKCLNYAHPVYQPLNAEI